MSTSQIGVARHLVSAQHYFFVHRSHLREIRDRSVLRLFEATDIGGGAFPEIVGVGSVSIPVMPASGTKASGPSSWDQDQSYFSEPEIDADYHQHNVHKSKVSPFIFVEQQVYST